MTGSQLPPADEWVTLTTRSLLSEADMLRLRLETNGIAVFIPDELTVSACSTLGTRMLGGIRLQVLQSDFQAAYTIKNELEMTLHRVVATCPVCHSQNVAYAKNRWNPLLLASLIFFFGVFLIFGFTNNMERLECCDCKHTWKVRKKSLHESAE